MSGPESLAAEWLAMVLLAGLGAPAALPARGSPTSGPFPAVAERVLDGDTVRVRARIWPGHEVVVDVRLRGIDAPELRGRCPGERGLAVRAREAVEAMVDGRVLSLRDVTIDKYGGRVVARLSLPDRTDIGQALLSRGLAHVYEGGARDPRAWCGGGGPDPGATAR